MDTLQEIRDLINGRELTELTAEELTTLNTLIERAADELGGVEDITDEIVEALNEVAGYSEAAAAEETRREEAQTARASQRDEALSRIRARAQGGEEDPDGEGDEDPEETPAEETPAEGTEAEGQEQQPIAASGTRAPRARAMGARNGRRPAPAPAPLSGTTTVTSDRTGQALSTRAQVVDEMTRALSNKAGRGRTSVVLARTEFPAARLLSPGNDASNEALVAAAFAPDALVAAGGLCAPLANVYDVNVTGTAARPVRDALPTFGADRGGINLRPSPVFQDWDGALGDWTNQNDIDAATAGAPDPTKNILVALCPGFTAFTVDATTQRVKFQNVTAKFDREGTAANLAAVDIGFARKAENKLLQKINALSVPIQTAKVLGGTRDILAHIDRIRAWWMSRHRLEDNTKFHMFIERWARDLMRADLTRGAHDDLDALAMADEQIAQWFARRNINVTWHLDGRNTAQVAATGVPAIARQEYPAITPGSLALPGFPDQLEMQMYIEGDFLLLDAGELDLGVIRDSTLNSTNSYEVFKEEFFGVAFRGIEALQISATVQATGEAAAYTSTSAIND